MATTALERIRELVATLSQPERAKLAEELIRSLDGPPEQGVEEAWAVEIERRIAEVREGRAELLEIDEVMRRVRERLRHP